MDSTHLHYCISVTLTIAARRAIRSSHGGSERGPPHELRLLQHNEARHFVLQDSVQCELSLSNRVEERGHLQQKGKLYV